MPVVRDEGRLSPERRSELVRELRRVLSSPHEPGGPVIFEIPFPRGRCDVLVVWEDWKDVTYDDRAEVIAEAYHEELPEKQTLLIAGLTLKEALEENWLPYKIEPMARSGEADPSALKQAMLAEGGIVTASGEVVLRLPSRRLADVAFERLRDELPSGYWAVAETVPTRY